MKRGSLALIVPTLTLAWLIIAMLIFIAISHYDFVQIYFLPLVIPFGDLFTHIAFLQYVQGLAQAIAGSALFSAACLSLGLRLIAPQDDEQRSRLAIGTTAFLLGEIVFSILFLSAIVLYQLTPLMVAIAFALGLAIGLPRLVAFVRGPLRLDLAAGLNGAEMLILWLIAAGMLLAILYTSAILNYDSVVQYFSNAKIMAVTHTAVYANPTDPFFVSSLHPGILYTSAIEIFGDQSARMLSWINGLAILLLGYAIGRELGITARGRLCFLAAMLTSTAFVDLLGDGKVELLSTAPLLAGVYWMLRSVQRPRRLAFVLIGCLLGFAMIARPYNLFLVPLFVIAFYAFHYLSLRRTGVLDVTTFLRAAPWMLLPLVALGTFHLLQNWLWLGNALAPLVSGSHLSATNWQWQFDPRLLNVYRIFYPFVVSFANSPQSLGNISPLFVGCLPFLLLKNVRQRLQQAPGLMALAFAALVTLVAWLWLFFTVVEIRYVFFLWVILFLVLGHVLDATITDLMAPLKGLIAPLVGILLIYMGVRTFVIALETYAPVDSQDQAHCDDLVFCTFQEPLNRSAPPGARVFVANAYRYYLRPDLFACSTRAQEYGNLKDLARQNSGEFWGELYRQGFRYVTYEDNFSNFHGFFAMLPSPQLAPHWLNVKELYSTPDGLERIYELEATAAPVRPETYCQLDSAGIWQVRAGAPAH